MLKKILKITIGLFFGNSAFAQWSSTSTTDPIYRQGSVGIGTSIVHHKLTVHITEQNDGVWLSGPNSKEISLISNTTGGAWNSLTQAGDQLLFWKGSGIDDINSGGLVIGPWTDLNRGMRITSAGNVGIGTANPLSTIHMHGGNLGQNAGDRINLLTTANTCGAYNYAYVNIYSYRNESGGNSWNTTSTRIENKIDADSKGFIEFNPKGLIGGLALGTNNTSHLFVSEGGNVGIGTTSNGSFKLAVEGKIAARGVKVTTSAFADYVFDSTYHLRPLAHVEQYINQNKHLPGIPSAKEVEKEGGFELGEMNVKLLEKVEELTLYILELNKKLEQQQKEINQLTLLNTGKK